MLPKSNTKNPGARLRSGSGLGLGKGLGKGLGPVFDFSSGLQLGLLGAYLLGSLALHLLFFASIYHLHPSQKGLSIQRRDPVSVKIKDENTKELPTTPPPKVPPLKKQKTPLSERAQPQKKPPTKPQKPVLGLDANSLRNDNAETNLTAPLGNSLLTKERGTPEEAATAIVGDQSQDAQLIRDSVLTPQYTEAALEVGLEGIFVVDVFVNAQGLVTEASLAKPVGFGMDPRLLTAARQARFSPRKNANGLALAGWTIIKFKLEIP